MNKRCWSPLIGAVLLLLQSNMAFSEWYESSGQAIVKNNNIQLARKQATQDAIKQALLFAGASVNSVQQLTDGLLSNDEFEIRSHGEVNQLQLVNESRAGSVITVTIHADIFAQPVECPEADYKKSLIMPWFNLNQREHAVTGELYDLGQHTAQRFHYHLRRQAPAIWVQPTQQRYIKTELTSQELMGLGRLHHAQYLFSAQIDNLAIDNNNIGWFSSEPERDFAINYQIKDLTNGVVIHSGQRTVKTRYEFDLHTAVDSSSTAFWQSSYGNAINAALDSIANEANSLLVCRPAHARVIEVKPDFLVIDMGKSHGVMVGDKLTLFQLVNRIDMSQHSHYRHSVFPYPAEVQQVFENTAIIINTDGLPFNNIQLNDYAVRR